MWPTRWRPICRAFWFSATIAPACNGCWHGPERPVDHPSTRNGSRPGPGAGQRDDGLRDRLLLRLSRSVWRAPTCPARGESGSKRRHSKTPSACRAEGSFPALLHNLDFLRRQAVEAIDVLVNFALQRCDVRVRVGALRREDFVQQFHQTVIHRPSRRCQIQGQAVAV
ncbi:MAG: hypothetical protein NZL93_05150 [Chthoniobacterales bacterium]|nr:hypothetical protein [Chthoniobacterales bacterium]